MDGKSREAIEVNAKIEKLLLAVHSAFDSLVERNKPFDAESVKNLYQGSVKTQITLLSLLDRHMDELRSRVGVDVAPTTLQTYKYTHRSLGKFIKKKQTASFQNYTMKRMVGLFTDTLNRQKKMQPRLKSEHN